MTQYQINLSDSLPDITANLLHDSRFQQLPSHIFEQVVLKVLNEIIDKTIEDFSCDPNEYLQPHHEEEIEAIAHDYLNQDIDKSDLNFYFPPQDN